MQCPNVAAPNCLADIVDQGVDDKGCKKTPKCIKKMSNGKDAEIKIMPETASQTAIDRLGELGFNVTLKETGAFYESFYIELNLDYFIIDGNGEKDDKNFGRIFIHFKT